MTDRPYSAVIGIEVFYPAICIVLGVLYDTQVARYASLVFIGVIMYDTGSILLRICN